MRKTLSVDFYKCRGCQICELICSFVKLGAFAPSKALIRVVHEYPAVERPIICLQCEDAPCARVCPVNAIFRKETGALIVNEKECTGCGLCLENCPFDVMRMNPSSRIAMKCDLCGGDPECVRICPPRALRFETLEGVSK